MRHRADEKQVCDDRCPASGLDGYRENAALRESDNERSGSADAISGRRQQRAEHEDLRRDVPEGEGVDEERDDDGEDDGAEGEDGQVGPADVVQVGVAALEHVAGQQQHQRGGEHEEDLAERDYDVTGGAEETRLEEDRPHGDHPCNERKHA